jgi:hypothetical protein
MGMRPFAISGLLVAGFVGAVALSTSLAHAQSFRAGEAVEASPLAIDKRWERCTVLGMVGPDVQVACGLGKTEYVVQAKWVRRAASTASLPDRPPARSTPATPRATPSQSVRAASALCPDAPRSLVGRKPQPHGICRIGARVTDRQGRVGTVIAALDGTTCQLCFDDGSSRSYQTWMLVSASGAASGAAGQTSRPGSTPSGTYRCSGGAAGNMRITITGGRWNGYYAETLPDGRVGISSQPNGRPYYMVCQR